MRHLGALVMLVVVCGSGCRPQTAVSPPVATATPEVIPAGVGQRYPWTRTEAQYEPVARRFPCPEGFKRVWVTKDSWGHWLRYLPLRAPRTPVRYLDGSIVAAGNDPSVGAVLDLDVRQYQECADVIIRLRAEWLRWKGQGDAIAFRSADGPVLAWKAWRQGTRVKLVGDHLRLSQSGRADASRKSFDRYLFNVFSWCGTISMVHEADKIAPAKLLPGDLFLIMGSPGHTVLVLDVAKDAAGHMKGLIAQGYLPAQSPHIVAADGSAWLNLDPARPVDVPRWGAFEWSDLRRLRPPGVPR
jgi:hypothetical protein